MRLRALSDCSSTELRLLLDEECRQWQDELLWDFRGVSLAVARGMDRGALLGGVLDSGERPLAYGYALGDAQRLVVGSLFATRSARGLGLEEELLLSVLREVRGSTPFPRVECQTLFSTADGLDRPLAQAGFRRWQRHYLVRDLAEPLPEPRSPWRLRRFRRDDLDAAARLIHASHVGSLDAELNLAYSQPDLCRGFVEAVVERSGCGPFDREASLVAEDGRGVVLGVILASRLSRTNGHVCQVSVLPEARGHGLGLALVVAALASLRRSGLASASLSVTVGNQPAYGIYEQLGFRVRKAFGAYAWSRPTGSEASA